MCSMDKATDASTMRALRWEKADSLRFRKARLKVTELCRPATGGAGPMGATRAAVTPLAGSIQMESARPRAQKRPASGGERILWKRNGVGNETLLGAGDGVMQGDLFRLVHLAAAGDDRTPQLNRSVLASLHRLGDQAGACCGATLADHHEPKAERSEEHQRAKGKQHYWLT